jgi:S1-C subfamily serine protease
MLPLRKSGGLIVSTSLLALCLVGCGSGNRTARSNHQEQHASAASLQSHFVHTVRTVAPSVVQIETRTGLGSGVVFDDHGDIVTNAHVVAAAKRFRVTLADGRRFSGSLVGSFVPDDLAVIRVGAGGLHAASFASTTLAVGDFVLAIGNPLGLRSSVTFGIVSALGRTVSEPNGAALPGVIQTSAPINPGNSGGALVALDGKVVGIPTLAAVDPQLGGSAPGIGFAIPTSTVRSIADQLIRYHRVVASHRAFLGVRVQTLLSGGVLVAAVIKNGPAARAGIRAGDVILSVDGSPTATADDLSAALATRKPGQRIRLEIAYPDGHKAKVELTLGQYSSGG